MAANLPKRSLNLPVPAQMPWITMTLDAITPKVMAVIDSNKSERDSRQKPLTLFAIPLKITMTFDAITPKVMAVIDSNKSERDSRQKPLTLFAIPLKITMTFDAITPKVMAVIDSNKSERDGKNRSHFLPSRSRSR